MRRHHAPSLRVAPLVGFRRAVPCYQDRKGIFGCTCLELISLPFLLLHLQVFRLSLKPYVPDFTTAFEHFCIHPGGKAVIEEVSKQLKLRPEQSLPMLVPFERYGNTSSSSTW